MAQQNILELANQGNPKAIAALMTYHLQPQHITAKAALKDSCLQVMLEAAQVPDQQTMIPFVRRVITSLGSGHIQKVKIYGKRAGEDFPGWSQEIELVTQTISAPSLVTSPLVMVQQNNLELAAQGDLKAFIALMNYYLQPKHITAKAALKNNCLQIVLEATQVPDQQTIVPFVYRGVTTSLGDNSIERIKIYGKRAGEDFSDWSQEIELGTQTISAPSSVISPPVYSNKIKKNTSSLNSNVPPSKSVTPDSNQNDSEFRLFFIQLNQAIRKLPLKTFFIFIGLFLAYQGISLLKTIESNLTAASKLGTAINLGMEASNIQQKLPHSLEVLQQSQTKWHKAINLLEDIPSKTNVSNQAQAQLKHYQDSLADVNMKIAVESKATADFQHSQELNRQADQIIMNEPDSQSALELSQEKRKQAIDLLATIPSETTISDVANNKLSHYRKNYEVVSNTLNALSLAISENSLSNDTETATSSNTDI